MSGPSLAAELELLLSHLAGADALAAATVAARLQARMDSGAPLPLGAGLDELLAAHAACTQTAAGLREGLQEALTAQEQGAKAARAYQRASRSP